MPCPCQNTFGQMPLSCPDARRCLTLALKDFLAGGPAPDTEALFRKFIDEFPVLSALDVFCNPCGRPRAISYHQTDPHTGSHPVPLDGQPFFYVMFSCNCPKRFAICHYMAHPLPTREHVLRLLRGDFV